MACETGKGDNIMYWEDDHIPQHRKKDLYEMDNLGRSIPQGDGIFGQLVGWLIGFVFNLTINLIIGILWSLPKYLWNLFFKK